jgi:pimeloyl-ACP methyl ester carboxylesterase
MPSGGLSHDLSHSRQPTGAHERTQEPRSADWKVPGVGHVPMADDPGSVTDAILRFLELVAPRYEGRDRDIM